MMKMWVVKWEWNKEEKKCLKVINEIIFHPIRFFVCDRIVRESKKMWDFCSLKKNFDEKEAWMVE